MAEITLETTEQDYILLLRNGATLATLRALLVPWARFAPEAVNIASAMSERDFTLFRAGLMEVLDNLTGEGQFTQDFQQRWGGLVMPERLIDASRKAEIWNVTLGTVLLGASTN